MFLLLLGNDSGDNESKQIVNQGLSLLCRYIQKYYKNHDLFKIKDVTDVIYELISMNIRLEPSNSRLLAATTDRTKRNMIGYSILAFDSNKPINNDLMFNKHDNSLLNEESFNFQRVLMEYFEDNQVFYSVLKFIMTLTTEITESLQFHQSSHNNDKKRSDWMYFDLFLLEKMTGFLLNHDKSSDEGKSSY